MKRTWIMIFCLMALGLSISNVLAADMFPQFEITRQRLYIPIEDIQIGYQEDLPNEVGFNFSYNIHGQLFTTPGQGHIQTVTEGFSGSTDKSTPWKTLTELLSAYQNGDVTQVKALYTTASQSEINQFLADSQVESRLISFMNAIAGMDVLIGFSHKEGFLTMVDVSYNDGSPNEQMSFYLVQAGSEYLLSTATISEAVAANISLFLQTGHAVAELPAPKHGLSIEKAGNGDGSVLGSGIDCGGDCIEVYVEGTGVWLKATPDEYSTFKGWSVNGEPLQDRLVIKADTTVTAEFSKIPPKEYTLTVETGGTGAGTIINSDTACETADCLELFSLYADEEERTAIQSGIDCGETCSVTYTEGTQISLKVVAAEGSEFVAWQINDEIVTGPVEISEDTIITAIFDEATPPAEELPIDEEQQPEIPEQPQP